MDPASGRLPRIEEREQVRVLESSRDLDLGEEALDAEDRAQLRLQQLERNPAVMPDVAREVHGRHPAGANLALDLVAAREGGGQQRDGVDVGG